MVDHCPLWLPLLRGQTTGGGSIPRWSAGKSQSVVTRRKPIGAVHKKSWLPLLQACRSQFGTGGGGDGYNNLFQGVFCSCCFTLIVVW